MFPCLSFCLHAFSSFVVSTRRISKNIRNSSISLIDDGRSSREIEAQLGVSHMTVRRVCAEARAGVQKSRDGRPTKLTATGERRLVRYQDQWLGGLGRKSLGAW